MVGDGLDRASCGDELEQALVLGAQPARAHRAHQRRHDHRVEHRATRGDLADRPRQLVAFGDAILEQIGVAGGALGQQRHRVLRIVELAEDHDTGPGVALADLLGGVDPFALEVRWHPDVADDDVRLRRAGAGDESVEVFGHSDDLDIGVTGEQRSNALADDDAVVGEKDPDPRHAE